MTSSTPNHEQIEDLAVAVWPESEEAALMLTEAADMLRRCTGAPVPGQEPVDGL